jgi:hypothetical protein
MPQRPALSPTPATPVPRRSFFRKLGLSVSVGAGIALVPSAASAAPTYCRAECKRATNGCARDLDRVVRPQQLPGHPLQEEGPRGHLLSIPRRLEGVRAYAFRTSHRDGEEEPMGIVIGVLALAAISVLPMLVLALARRVVRRFGLADDTDQPVR